MNFKSNKGVTLMALTITIIVMLIITGVIINNAGTHIRTEKVNKLYNDIETLNNKIEDYYIKYGNLPILGEVYCNKTKLNNILSANAQEAEAILLTYDDTTINPNDGNKYYVINLEKLEGLTLNYGYRNDYKAIKKIVENDEEWNVDELEDVYIINENTHQIYYPNGVFADNIMHYVYNIDTSKIEGLIQARLPEEYQEVEYIESTGTQYIDTGYKPNGNTSYSFKYSDNKNSGVMFGAYDGDWNKGNGLYINLANSDSGNPFLHYKSNTRIPVAYNENATIKIDKGKIYFNDSTIPAVELPTQEFSVNHSTYIFCGNWSGTKKEQLTSYKLYYFEIWDNETLVRDFIPCYRISDNAVGLYDIVEDKFYANAGTETFGKGNDVIYKPQPKPEPEPEQPRLPAEYQEVEYIQSSGTQYIDTGVAASSTIGCKINFQPLSSGTIFGAITSVDVAYYGMNLTGNKYEVYWGNGPYPGVKFGNYNYTTKFNISFNYLNNKEIYLNNTKMHTLSENPNITTNNIHLFKLNEGSTTYTQYISAKIYDVKITDGENIIREFIPCYRNSDGEIGLYDLVEEKFYANAGTGTFEKGPDVIYEEPEPEQKPEQARLPSEYQEVEYITFDGNSYIDTEYIAKPTTGARYKYYPTRYTTNGPHVLSGRNYYFPLRRSGGSLFLIKRGNVEYTISDSNSPQIFEIEAFMNNDIAIINGVEHSNLSLKDGATNDNMNLYLGTYGGNPTYSEYKLVGNVYYCEIYENNELVRNLIPCYRKSDNVVGFCDLVEGKFYTNKGTGAFERGPDVIYDSETEPEPEPEQAKLPGEYQEVQYIQSTGTQYIDTGIIGNNNIKVELDFEYTSTTTGTYIFGACTAFNSNAITLSYNPANSKAFRTFYGLSVPHDVGNFRNAIGQNVRSVIYMDNSKLIQNGNEYAYTDISNNDFETPSSIAIFCRNRNGTYEYNSAMKLYYFKIWNEDTLTRNFIPCYRKSDKVVGLYDLVEGKFYTNAGTGDFQKGIEQRDLPSEYQQVEYIQSTGTQYIDTGTKLNQDSKVEIELEVTENGDYNVFGSRTSATENNIDIIYGSSWSQTVVDFQNYTVNRLEVKNPVLTKTLYTISNQKLSVGSNSKQISGYTNFTTPGNAYIFDVSGGKATSNNMAKMKLYYCKIWNGETLIRDFIPSYRKSDNVVGLYDLVEGKFYTNAGTGTFLKGLDV